VKSNDKQEKKYHIYNSIYTILKIKYKYKISMNTFLKWKWKILINDRIIYDSIKSYNDICDFLKDIDNVLRQG